MKQLLYISLVIILIFIPLSSSANEDNVSTKPSEEINLARHYKVSWSNFDVANLYVSIVTEQVADDILYQFQVVIKSYGLAKMISGFKSDTITIVKAHNENYYPLRFATSFKLRKKRRDITLTYSKDGKKIIKDVNIPAEYRWKRKAVSQKLKDGSYDPLTIVFAARKKIKEAIEQGGEKQFLLPLYDGRRRSDIKFTIYPERVKKLIHISFQEEAIAGYTDNEKSNLIERSSVIHVYLSPDDYFPVSAEGDSQIGSATIALEKECKTMADCMN